MRLRIGSLGQAAVARHGGNAVAVIHSNAYVHRPGAPATVAPDPWDQVLAVNVQGLLLAVQTFIADLVETSGSVVATSSVQRFGIPGYTAYAASKGALESVVRQLAVELAPHVRVTSVVPGPIGTHIWDEADEAAAVFLASPQASFVTGASLVVDGGWSIKEDSP